MKTLQSTISKLKQDNFLVQKKIMENENITKRIAKNNQNELIKKNQLKAKKNKVFSQITNQSNKNKFEKGEQKIQKNKIYIIKDIMKKQQQI